MDPMEQPATDLLLIGGRSGSGKSSVANELHHLLAQREVMHAVIEGDNLDSAYPPTWQYKLAEANLQAIWRNYRALGHRKLIYTNTPSVLDSNAFAEAIEGPVQVTGVLLTATDQTIRQRLSLREVGSALAIHLQRSRVRAADLEERCPAWVHRIITDRKSVTDVATEILELIDWI
jgi:broad-specificity NMP kinase